MNYIIGSQRAFPKNKDPYWEIIRSRHAFEPDRDPLNSIPCTCQDFIARALLSSVAPPPSLAQTGTRGINTRALPYALALTDRTAP
jgi:hypothetical protein